jgi:hypothetical protein
MMRKSGSKSGSVYLSRRINRHGFLKNRHSYFTNPLICPRIGVIMPIACPEKAAFGTVWNADNSQNGLQPVGIRKNHCFSWKFGIRPERRTLTYRKVEVLDHVPIRISLGGHSELEETEPESGSDSSSMGLHRHGFTENRHGYFTNPSICPRIGGMISAACPEKAAFGTVWNADNSQNGLQYVQYAGRKGTGDLDQLPFRTEGEYRGLEHRMDWKNDENIKTDRVN